MPINNPKNARGDSVVKTDIKTEPKIRIDIPEVGPHMVVKPPKKDYKIRKVDPLLVNNKIRIIPI